MSRPLVTACHRRDRSVRRRRGSRIVHGSADRHRHDAGSRAHDAAAGWSRSRRSRRWRRPCGRRQRPEHSSPPGWTPAATTSSRRCTASPTPRSFSPERLVEVDGRDRGRAGGHARSVVAADRHGARVMFVGDGAVSVCGHDRQPRGPDVDRAGRRAAARRGRSAGWRVAAARSGRDHRSGGVQPLYVRRPDVEIGAGAPGARPTPHEHCSIEPLDVGVADRRCARDRGGVVHQSVDARDVSGRARERPGVSFCYLARDR